MLYRHDIDAANLTYLKSYTQFSYSFPISDDNLVGGLMARLDDRTGTGLSIALSAVATLVAVVSSATFGLSHPAMKYFQTHQLQYQCLALFPFSK